MHFLLEKVANKSIPGSPHTFVKERNTLVFNSHSPVLLNHLEASSAMVFSRVGQKYGSSVTLKWIQVSSSSLVALVQVRDLVEPPFTVQEMGGLNAAQL